MRGLSIGAGVVLAGIALVTAWHLLEPAPPPPAPKPPPELFDPSKPLGVMVSANKDQAGKRADVVWLERELRYLLTRNEMHVAPVTAKGQPKFVLAIEIAANGRDAHIVRPAAPDNPVVIDKEVPLPTGDRLALVRALIAQLPTLLDSTRSADQWLATIGTTDANAYESYLGAEAQLLGPDGHGFTHTMAAPRGSTLLDSLESLTRRQPDFARGHALLALAFLSQTGKDEASLGKLAQASADRALARDPELASAHAAVGLAALRDNDWIGAGEHFSRALALDANALPALEGAACLYADTGRGAAALEAAQRAIALQSHNAGAEECAVFATGVTDAAMRADGMTFAPMISLLANDLATARKTLPATRGADTAWVDAVLRAAEDPAQLRDALQALTRAANDKHIDPTSEILSGAALRQPDFVFNRLLRLKRQHLPAPLRVLWLPQTQFLRQHPRYSEIVDAFALPAYWQANGAPDLCATESALYGCRSARRNE